MAGEQSKTVRTQIYISILALAPVAALFAFSLTDSSTDLTPGHADVVVAVALAAAILAAVIVGGLLIWLKPSLQGPRIVALPAMALLSGLLVGLLTLNSADRILQLIDFSGHVVRSQRQFQIARAYVSHGKGVSYHIQLADPFADLSLTRDNYIAIFGTSEEVKPVGYCLNALVEQRGQAMRIMYPSVHPIPDGRVGWCASGLPTP